MPPPQLNLSAAEYLDSGAMPFRLIRREPEGEYPLHRHEFSELVIVFGGSGGHLAFGEKHPLRPGDVFMIGNPGTSHGFCGTRDLALYNILFNLKSLGATVQSLSYPVLAELRQLELTPGGGAPLHLEPGELRGVLKILRSIEREQGHAQAYSAIAQIAGFILLLVELARLRRRHNLPGVQRVNERFSDLLHLLAERPEHEYPRRELADRLCVSESTLQRIFKTHTGFSPHDYLLQLRLKKASALLMESELSIGEVAGENGFAYSNYFCRCFRLYSGCSPLEFRRRNRL